MRVRPEEPRDSMAVCNVNEAAFESTLESRIVELIRGREPGAVSLVADSGGEVLGHILFSPVAISGHPNLHLMAIGPMSVLPGHQREGIGSALIREGLCICEGAKCDAIFVLGHPEYYPRFGFMPASRYGISCEYDVPDEAFMLLELNPGSLQGVTGKVIYHEAFAEA